MTSQTPAQYSYIGPESLRKSVGTGAAPIRTVEQLNEVLRMLGRDTSGTEAGTTTFVIGLDGFLRIAHRRSEHVACAGGGDVLSAGEMTFGWDAEGCFVENVTNQSTGYCPEPQSWGAVESALDRIGIRHPPGFSPELIFRRYPSCQQTNLVKDSFFFCDVCNAALPSEWNFSLSDVFYVQRPE